MNIFEFAQRHARDLVCLKTEIGTTSPYHTARYAGKRLRLKRITPGKVYGILTNKAYLGIRGIHKRNKTGYEEVPAAWQLIITELVFLKARTILQSNKDRYHRRCGLRYLSSGLHDKHIR